MNPALQGSNRLGIIMNVLRRVFHGLSDALGAVGSLLVILLILHVSLDVVMRNVFGAPIAGTIEFVSNYYMIGITFLPLALVERRDAHITVEVLTEMMSPRAVFILTVLATLLGIVVMGLLCWRSYLEAISNYRRGSVLMIAGSSQLPVWPSYFLLPLGFGCAALLAVWKLICLLTRTPFGAEAEDFALTSEKENDHE